MTKKDMLSYLEECREPLEKQSPDVKGKSPEELFDHFFGEITSRSTVNKVAIREEIELHVRNAFNGVEIPVFDDKGIRRGDS